MIPRRALSNELRGLSVGLALFALVCLIGSAVVAADTPSGQPLVRLVDSVGIPVTNINRSIDFYAHVLGFRLVADRTVSGDAYEHLFGLYGIRLRVVRMQLGEESIELMQFLSPQGRSIPADSQSNDRWFQHVAIIVSDMERAYAVLRANDVAPASPEPQVLPAWNESAGGIAAYYFFDPDGNHLELLHFPPDKGAAKWHRPTRSLFLGIDHTAIVVQNTAASIAYYHDTLGFDVAGRSDNYGPEQERLNNVFGAHLHITALRAHSGPGIELLEYVTPRTGRPYPSDTLADDHWQWTTNLRAVLEARPSALEPLDERTWISNHPIDLNDDSLGYHRAFMLRDPDGHVTNLILQ
jgi:catechol 2,3-dioxygenase-like lactoylglutathione lyase family enzyme